MKVRIAVIGAQVETTGSEEALIADSLRADGHAVTAVPVTSSTPAFLLRLARLARIDIAHVFWGTGRSFLTASVPAMLAARFFGKRVVLHCHRREAEQHLAQSGWLVHPWLALADEIVVPSESAREAFARFGHRGRVINSVVDLAGYEFRERSGSEMGVLCVSDLEPGHGVDAVIRGFAMLKLRYPEAVLTIAGAGSDDARLRTLAGSLNVSAIRFIGRVGTSRLPALFKDAAFVVNASDDTASAITCLRAFAAGARVVSTSSGDLAAMLRHGVNGLVVAPDGAALAAAVSVLAEDVEMAARVVRQAREDAVRYTWSAVRGAWAACYARVSVTAEQPEPVDTRRRTRDAPAR